jgi:hypothetical protein
MPHLCSAKIRVEVVYPLDAIFGTTLWHDEYMVALTKMRRERRRLFARYSREGTSRVAGGR